MSYSTPEILARVVAILLSGPTPQQLYITEFDGTNYATPLLLPPRQAQLLVQNALPEESATPLMGHCIVCQAQLGVDGRMAIKSNRTAGRSSSVVKTAPRNSGPAASSSQTTTKTPSHRGSRLCARITQHQKPLAEYGSAPLLAGFGTARGGHSEIPTATGSRGHPVVSTKVSQKQQEIPARTLMRVEKFFASGCSGIST
jgi:hypothetical protein